MDYYGEKNIIRKKVQEFDERGMPCRKYFITVYYPRDKEELKHQSYIYESRINTLDY